jgi:plasmid stabilization system protein ParE
VAYQIIWSPRALSDLAGICERISVDSPYYASRFAQRVVSLVERLAVFPRMGRVVPEYDDENVRQVIHQNYRIIYRLRDGAVEVAAIHHGAQLLGEL